MEKPTVETKDVSMKDVIATNNDKDTGDNDDEEEELSGIDLEGIEDAEEEEEENNDTDVDMDVTTADNDDNSNNVEARKSPENEEALSKLQAKEAEEAEAARRERMELLAAEQKAAAEKFQYQDDVAADPKTKFEHLLAQSDVFAHFLAGSVAVSSKKGKKGSRGKKGRLTEAEEDAQLLKASESKRSTVRLDKQPGILSKNVTMHKYQLEGLNWMIKLHDSGINGILADGASFFNLLLATWRDCVECF